MRKAIPIRSIFSRISADIVTTLSYWPWLFIIARDRTFTFKRPILTCGELKMNLAFGLFHKAVSGDPATKCALHRN